MTARTLRIAFCAAIVATFGACASSGDESTDTGGRPVDTGRQDTGNNDTGGTDTGNTDTGGNDTGNTDTGGNDTGGNDTGNTDTGGGDTTEVCEEIAVTADGALRPADIIWAIDTSGSMTDEAAIVEDSINDFANFIGSSGIDYAVVMIASHHDFSCGIFDPDCPNGGDYFPVCVPPPLSGSPGCPDTANNPTFLHPHLPVYSTDALQVLSENYIFYSQALRDGAKKHIIVVTDDQSSMSASAFNNAMAALPAPGFGDYTVHGIIQVNGSTCGVEVGTVYQTLANQTGGVIADVCSSNWGPIFQAIQDSVVDGAIIPCGYAIPTFGEGQEFNPELVNVYYTDTFSNRTLLPAVDGVEFCSGQQAWYYDNPAAPTTINICSSACGDIEGELEIAFGCNTVKI